MQPSLKQSMFEYYDDRADGYEASFCEARNTTHLAIPDAESYRQEFRELLRIIPEHVGGDVIDLACGTAYWLEAYAPVCRSITLFDQAGNMLHVTRQKVAALGIAEKCELVRGDLFAYDFPAATFDTVFSGFLFSHVTPEQESQFFDILHAMLKPDGHFLLLDSRWTKERAKTRQRTCWQARTLENGKQYHVYKHYLDTTDFLRLGQKNGFAPTVVHEGRLHIAVAGKFQ